nr:Tn3 family transposase [Nocardia africana]
MSRPSNAMSKAFSAAFHRVNQRFWPVPIRSVAGGDHGHSEEDIRYVRRRYLTAEAARQIGIEIANATFRVRRASVWGEGSTAVASDSTHFGSWDQNIFTEWHSRYGGRGVLICWSVEKGSVVIHSQRINCSASEVHAMVEGAIHHGTEMTVEANYVDTHGQSESGSGSRRCWGSICCRGSSGSPSASCTARPPGKPTCGRGCGRR